MVDLEVQTGGYEKSTVHIIDAESKQKAMLQAMADESHGNANMDDTEYNEGVWWDLGGEFAYKINKCQIVDEVHLKQETIKGLVDSGFFFVSKYDEEQILELIDEDAKIRDIDKLLAQL